MVWERTHIADPALDDKYQREAAVALRQLSILIFCRAYRANGRKTITTISGSSIFPTIPTVPSTSRW